MTAGTDRPKAREVFTAAAEVARKGIQVVKLYGVKDDATCTCGKGSACDSPGKHPKGNDWPSRATTDEEVISDWFDYSDSNENNRVNIGVKLGKVSGVIDIEFDSPEAEATLKRYGLDKIETPTYTASRGAHRLFLWDEDLPDVARVKVDSLEVHIGGDGKGVQSVLPPSWHRTGTQYAWVLGLSLDEVDPAPVPAHFKAAIKANSKEGGSGCVRDAMKKLTGNKKLGPGERHQFLLGVVSGLVFNERDLSRPSARSEVLALLEGVNATRCDPPKSQQELEDLVDSQFRFYSDARAHGMPNVRSTDEGAQEAVDGARDPWEIHGLELNDGLWNPGRWRLTVVHSDPVRYRLCIGEGSRINLNSEEFLHARKVARRILEATATVNMLDPTPKKWEDAWSGYNRRNNGHWESVRGLCPQLMEEPYVAHEYPSAEHSRSATVAGLLLDNLSRPRKPSDEKDTKPSGGSAKWLFHEGTPELWFEWKTVWKEINAEAELPVTSPEKQDLEERLLAGLGVEKFTRTEPRMPGGGRKKFLRWGDRHLNVLARLAGLDEVGL
jgi:hypothetical protein